MTDLVLDFGSLSANDEQEYIDAILTRGASRTANTHARDIVQLLAFTHAHIRKLHEADPAAAVSLRDVERFVRVHEWLQECGAGLLLPATPIDHFLQALFVVYVCRL